jgi:hypothetical protein
MVEKTVDRCELSIVKGSLPLEEGPSKGDTLESMLIVRLHCKHSTVRYTFLALLGSNKVINRYRQNAPFIIIDSNIVDDSWGARFAS